MIKTIDIPKFCSNCIFYKNFHCKLEYKYEHPKDYCNRHSNKIKFINKRTEK